MPSEKTASDFLEAHLQGDAGATEQLVPMIYDELRRIAGALMRGERADHTLQPTALANEALMRLIPVEGLAERGRLAFLRIASRTMRRVLVDHERKRRAEKRPPPDRRVTLIDPVRVDSTSPLDVVALDDALTRLERLSKRQAEVVELRYFGGRTLEEAAAIMGIGRETAKDHWTLARAWLNRELTRSQEA